MSFLPAGRYPHGTRARYVADRCRCDRCKGANTAYYHDRRRRALEAAAEVQPSRRAKPQYTAFVRSKPNGGAYTVTPAMCPGVNGNPCVRGGAWLKNYTRVCSPCVERATVWNGLVPARRARKHLLELRAKGIGRRSVAAASDVAETVVADILSGAKKKIRARTERRVLSVDEGARADGSLVPAAKTYELLADLVARGFTGKWISRELGYCSSYASVLQDVKREHLIARTAADVEKLHRRVLEQGIVPRPKWDRVDATDTNEKVDRLLREGFTIKLLSRRIGVWLRYPDERRALVARSTAEKVARFYRDIMAGEGELDVDLVEPARDEGKLRRLIAAYLDGVPMEDLEQRFEMQARQIYRAIAAAGAKKRDQERSADAA